tara:strand:+ start:992 stop:1423 length:432 start_codon:yes stop_codon:yes gene_type:complete
MEIIKIKKIDEKISNFIFNLRNKSYVRKNSLKNSKINLKNHQTWVQNFSKKNNKLYVIMQEKILIGYFRLEFNKKMYNTSWALIKKFHGKGYAKKGLNYVTKNKSYKYKAVIKKNNLASLNVATFANFKLKRTKNNIFYLYKN